MNPGQAITTYARQLPARRRYYAALCVLARALVTPHRAYWLASGAAVYAWKAGPLVCVDLRHIPASHGRRLYVEGRDTPQSIRALFRYAGLTEDDLQAALEGELADERAEAAAQEPPQPVRDDLAAGSPHSGARPAA